MQRTCLCSWRFIKYEPYDSRIAVSGSWHPGIGKDYWHCSVHFNSWYGSDYNATDAVMPPNFYCENLEKEHLQKEKLATRRRRWWLFKTLPKRLWSTLLGNEHGDCE